MADHIRINLTNFAIISVSAALGVGALIFVLTFFKQRNWPVVTPAANALLAVTANFPK